jgi:hypothetical protein
MYRHAPLEAALRGMDVLLLVIAEATPPGIAPFTARARFTSPCRYAKSACGVETRRPFRLYGKGRNQRTAPAATSLTTQQGAVRAG